MKHVEHYGPGSDYETATQAWTNVEALLIGRMLSEYNGPVSGCDSADFFDTLMGLSFHAINLFRGQNMPATPETIWAAVCNCGNFGERNGLAALNRCVSIGVGDSSREEDLATLVSQQAARRELHSELQVLAGEIFSEAQPIEEIASNLDQALTNLRACSSTITSQIVDVVDSILSDLNSPPMRISTGLPSIDEALFGGMWAGKMYGLQGRSKIGKSLMASTLTLNALRQGIPSLYVALEMGSKQVTHRLIGQDLGLNALAFLNDQPCGPNHPAVKAARAFAAKGYPLFFHFNPRLTFERLKVVLWDHVRRHGVRFVVIDYWQLVGGCSPKQSLVDHLNNVAQWTADFAANTGTVVVMPAQENRNEEPYMGDGLRKACDMYLRIRQPENDTGVPRRWLEMMDTRYTPNVDVGSNEAAPLWIDFKRGPSFQDDAA